jgi:hypothetical protein
MVENELKRVKRDLWRTTFAKQSVQRAIDACTFIISKIKAPEHPLYYPLVTAIFVLYGRPFGDNKGVGMISEKLASYDSPEKNNLHALLIKGRDKLYAHTDAEFQYFDAQRIKPLGSLLSVSIIYTDVGGGFAELNTRIQEPQLTIQTVPLIKKLCEELLIRLDSKEKEILTFLAENGCKLKPGKNIVEII